MTARNPEPRPGDILAALGELGLLDDARISGTEAQILCPYHDDRTTGSFALNLETGLNHCFACGNGGSFHRFLMAARGMDRQQARRWCLKRLIATTPPEQYRQKHQKTGEPEVSEASLAVFGDPPEEILHDKAVSRAACAALGILWDPRAGNLIFPVRDPYTGQLHGWQEKTRYRFRNRPTGIPVKSCLFGWHLVRPASMAVLVESPVDTAVMLDAGYTAVSSYGAEVTDAQLAAITDRCASLVLALDDDNAGWKMTDLILRKPRPIPVSVFNYGDSAGKDPGEIGGIAIRWGMETRLC